MATVAVKGLIAANYSTKAAAIFSW